MPPRIAKWPASSTWSTRSNCRSTSQPASWSGSIVWPDVQRPRRRLQRLGRRHRLHKGLDRRHDDRVGGVVRQQPRTTRARSAAISIADAPSPGRPSKAVRIETSRSVKVCRSSAARSASSRWAAMYRMGRLRCLLAAAANKGAADPPGPAAVAAPWGSARSRSSNCPTAASRKMFSITSTVIVAPTGRLVNALWDVTGKIGRERPSASETARRAG